MRGGESNIELASVSTSAWMKTIHVPIRNALVTRSSWASRAARQTWIVMTPVKVEQRREADHARLAQDARPERVRDEARVLR